MPRPHRAAQPTLSAAIVRGGAPRARRTASLPPRRAPERRSALNLRVLALLTAGLLTVCSLLACGALGLGGLLIYGRGVLPGVSAYGVALGGMSEAQAAEALRAAMHTITLADPATGREWRVESALLGLAFDAAATAQRAYAQGRGEGGLFEALSGVTITPVYTLVSPVAVDGLDTLRDRLDIPARSAGIALVDGRATTTPPVDGRVLDSAATLTRLRDEADALRDGRLALVMTTTRPAVTDVSALLATAEALLNSPLTARVFDPVTGDIVTWDAPPHLWGGWLTAESAPESASGLRLTLDASAVRAFLQAQAAVLDAGRYLDLDAAVAQTQAALAANRTTATLRVYHRDRTHTVRAGETIISIAWDYGVPYPWVQRANGGIEAISVGQQLVIPSPDNFFDFEPVPDKRIVVSLSQQRTRVYEYGQLKWDWPSSTGISSSPTWPGVYQIISHVPNAYAANWNLWMPQFMGVYRPVPGQDFTNGFHGFPTRGGGQVLWENSLGRRVTYGCILLSNTNAKLLYDWAETGVIVEIVP